MDGKKQTEMEVKRNWEERGEYKPRIMDAMIIKMLPDLFLKLSA